MLKSIKISEAGPVVLIFTFLFQVQVSAQANEADTLIRFHGYILDSVSAAPGDIPVEARIILERLPYGSEIGILSSNDSTGYFKYFLSPDHDYRIVIKHQGYHQIEETLKSKSWASKVMAKNYYLRPEWKQDQVIRLRKLIFEQGRAVISRASLQELNRLAQTLNENRSMVIQLEGHTDWRGDHESNMILSEERVDAVKHYLVSAGVDPKRIKTKAFGGTNPLTRDDSLEASSINRRVEVRILKID